MRSTDAKHSSTNSLVRRVLEAGALVASLALAGIVIAGYAGYLDNARALWPVQFAAFAAPAALVGLLLLGAAWAVARRWKLALAHAVLLSAAMVPRGLSSEAGDPASSDAAARPSLTVMSFNSRGGGVEDPARMETAIRDVAPDVIAFQEFQLHFMRSSSVLGGGVDLVALIRAGYEPGRPASSGVRTVSRPTFARTATPQSFEVLAGEIGARGIWKSGGVSRTVLDWQGRSIVIYNIHLHSFGPSRPWETGEVGSLRAWRDAFGEARAVFQIRAEQVRILRQWLEAEEFPYIVCGDLNSTTWTWAYGHLARPLQDSFRIAGKGWGATYPARLPAFRIDYVLASRHWEVKRAYVYDAVYSDHRPVVAELALRP